VYDSAHDFIHNLHGRNAAAAAEARHLFATYFSRIGHTSTKKKLIFTTPAAASDAATTVAATDDDNNP
jgi:hypothetical protein